MKTAICTCIKDEHSYLKEWIEWHLDRGFDHIFLFEDYGSKSHAEVVAQYDCVTILPISVAENEPIHKRQDKAFSYSLKMLKGQYDWAAYIDVDEFIDFEDGWDLQKLTNEFADKDGVLLSWVLYNANGKIDKGEGGVVSRFPDYDLDARHDILWGEKEWCVKSIVNLNRNPKFRHIHYIENGVNTNGKPYAESKLMKKAWIRHYYTKSWEEWVWRIMERGDLCNGNRKLAQFFNANPDMLPMKEQLIRSVAHRIPHGKKCYILDAKNMIIAGGNVAKIMEMNNKLKNENSR